MSTDLHKDNQSAAGSPMHSLIMDFQMAQAILNTIDIVDLQAKATENETLTRFSSYKKLSDPYVRPQDLPLEEDESLTYSSLNSHLQKVQSEQIKNKGLNDIDDLQQNANTAYINKKVTIKVLDKSIKPIHNCWLDKRTRQVYYGSNNKQSISGTVSEINLSGNYLVLKPKTSHQLLNSSLKGYLIEVINPNTGQPIIGTDKA